MSERLFIMITNSDPRNPCEILEPIYTATVAASMDYKVEVIFSGRSGEIAVKGVAENVPHLKDENKSIYDLIKDAHEAGVVFKATKHLTTKWGDDLIPEVDDIVGSGYVVSRVMSDSSETMTF